MEHEDRAKAPYTSETSLYHRDPGHESDFPNKPHQSLETLRESEAFFRAVTQNSADMIIIVDRTGRITYVNPAVEHVMGYVPEELVGRSAFSLITKDDLPRAVHDFGKAILSKDVVPNAFKVKHKDGSHRILEGVGKNMYGNPDIRGFVMNVRDMTERVEAEKELQQHQKHLENLVAARTAELKRINEELRRQLSERLQAEKSLEASEARFRTLIQKSSDVISIFNSQGMFFYVSPSAEAVLGYPPEKLLEKSPFDFIHPDDREAARQAYVTVAAGTNQGIPTEFRFRKGDGTWIHLEALGQNLLDYPGIKGIVITCRDITERKKTEATLKEHETLRKRLFESSSLPIIVLDAVTFRLIDCNQATIDVFGFDRYVDAVGKAPLDISPPLQPDGTSSEEKARFYIGQALNEGGISFDWLCRRPDGTLWNAEVHLVRFQSGPQKLLQATVIDITERKDAEARLRESERRFKELADLLPEAVFEADMNLRFTFVNQKALTFFGYTENEARVGLTCLDMVAPADRERVIENFGKRIRNQIEGSVAYTALRKDGTTFPALISLTVITENGQHQGVRGIVIDLTETKKAEDALRESEWMIRRILSATPVGIGLTVEKRVKWVNEAWLQIFGFQNDQACMDLPVSVLYPSGDSYNESRRRIYAILENTGIASIEAYMSRQDGTVFPAQINVAPLDPSDLSKGAISTIVDISEWKKMEQSLRESEEKYRLAMDATSDALWDWDIPSGTVYYSPAWRQILGEAMDNHLSSWESRMHPEEKESVWRSLLDHLEGKSEGWSQEFRLATAGGQWKWVLGRGSVIAFDTEGKPRRMVGTVIDIDDRKFLESQLIQAQKMEAIGTLAGGIAHDFNNILASISGYTELSLMKNHQHEARENYLRQVLQACERAKNLVNQILLFSRQREGEKKPVEIKLIVKEVTKMIRASLPSTIKIRQYASPDALLVLADPIHIHQIVMNLCTNAAHAMRENGGELNVSLDSLTVSRKTNPVHPTLKDGLYAYLRVTDTGHGIDAAIIDKIFDPFFTTKGLGEGTGLGLSVVYGIVNNYGGHVSVSSRVGEGAAFHVYLPCIDTGIPDALERVDPPSLAGAGHLLIVDDEKDIVLPMSKYLASMGYDVQSTTSSLEALNRFRDNPQSFDLIITDMTMPHMTGLKLSEALHAIRPETPIILCTGYHELITEAEAKQHGIREFVLKPIRFSELSRLICSILEQKETS